MRTMRSGGVCACCGKAGGVWTNVLRVLDFGVDSMPPLEPDTSLPDLCDDCDYAQRRWDAWVYSCQHIGAGYPYWEGPPKSPPVRR